jgi:aminoglycoside phosphotransferase (APT) family kinase protein
MDRLSGWLVEVTGDRDAAFLALEMPEQGTTSATRVGRVMWEGREVRLVLRVEPDRLMQFPRNDVLAEGEINELLARHGVPVPRVLWKEATGRVLGTPFIVLEFVEGRVPPTVPGHHTTGWVTAVSAAERRRMYTSGLRALVDLHEAPWQGLERINAGRTADLDGFLERLTSWHDWVAQGRDLAMVNEGLEAVLRDRPTTVGAPSLIWGDARLGNMIFGEDYALGALLDFDMPFIGPAEVDIAWWAMFEEWMTVGWGVEPLEGVPVGDELFDEYTRLGGREILDRDYWVLLSAVRMSVITARFTDLQVAAGRMPAETTMQTENPFTQMIARRLGRPLPGLSAEYAAVSAAAGMKVS